MDSKKGEDVQKGSLLAEYFASSPQFAEFFALWEFLQQRDRARSFVGSQLLDALEAILRCAGPDSPAGSVLSRELLNKKLQPLVVNLTSEFNAILVSSLKLLKTISLQGPWQAREVFRNMNFGSKSTARLIDRRQNQAASRENKKGPPQFEMDVRTHFVRLGLGFLKSEDDHLIEEVLGMKGFLGSSWSSRGFICFSHVSVQIISRASSLTPSCFNAKFSRRFVRPSSAIQPSRSDPRVCFSQQVF